MKARLYFTKRFTSGNLEGITLHEHMDFTDAHRAQAWLHGVRDNESVLDYEITDYTFIKRRCDA